MSLYSFHNHLARAVDEHTDWFIAWHRLAFIDHRTRSLQVTDLPQPESFAAWRQEAVSVLSQDQPAIEKLAATHEQLHTLARLILMKTPDHQPVSEEDYKAVVDKYRDLIQGLRRLEQAFALMASRMDPLTGLRTRVDMQDELQREMSRFDRNGKSFCLAIIDIDHFKKVNDVHGHNAGDKVLMAVANHISRGLRAFDDAYRLGGEEFLLCLKEADKIAGLTVLERLRLGLMRKPVLLDDGTSLSVTASFGMVVSTPDTTIETMMARADQALYRAKNDGRNCIKLG